AVGHHLSLPRLPDHPQPIPGVPIAEKAHTHTIKLPVWHREQDLKLAGQYVSAARKAGEHHKELL
ncbi:hypothetical protein ACWGJW_19905, partial [Streptomyces nigrescens]